MGMASKKIWLEGDGRCHYCRVPLVPEIPIGKRNARRKKSRRATQDHVIPLIKGGPNTAANLVLCCYLCNTRKGDDDYEVFVKSHWLKERRKTIRWQFTDDSTISN